jgi:hypothetical protein
VVREHHQEGALAADEEGRRAVAQTCTCLRQGETELSEVAQDLLSLARIHDGLRYPPAMREDVARRVYEELKANGYSPKMHEPGGENGLFEISLPGHGFDLADFKTMAKVTEDFGLGLKLGDDARIMLS